MLGTVSNDNGTDLWFHVGVVVLFERQGAHEREKVIQTGMVGKSGKEGKREEIESMMNQKKKPGTQGKTKENEREKPEI